ncbi:MAG TPA: hypothetical protein VK912_00580 [Longimicrobiales bacterium]|nr:hypothetical protein [Longimicrobiales bacterium]
MRRLTAFALLFFCATAVQAQDPVPQEPVTTEVAPAAPAPAAAEAAPARAPEAPVPSVDLSPRSPTATAIDAATMRAPADMDEAAQDVTAPRNFWWLVGAIVLGGIILAVLL